jgi:hypothetical protein
VGELLSNLLGGILWQVLIGVGLGLFLLLSLLFGYVHLGRELQSARGSDPQLGLKTILHYFFSVAVLLALTGASMILGDLLYPDSEYGSDAQRGGAALLIVGSGFAVLHFFLLLRGTNDRLLPAAGRFFTGWRLAIHGFVVVGATAWLAMLLLQKMPRTFAERELLAIRQHYLYGVLLVWGPSWVAHLIWYWRYLLRSPPPAELTWEAKD